MLHRPVIRTTNSDFFSEISISQCTVELQCAHCYGRPEFLNNINMNVSSSKALRKLQFWVVEVNYFTHDFRLFDMLPAHQPRQLSNVVMGWTTILASDATSRQRLSSLSSRYLDLFLQR